jgi:hypothetical protein
MKFRARHAMIGLCAVLVAELGGVMAMQQAPVVTRSALGPFRGTPPELAQPATRLGIPDKAMARLQVRWGLPAGLHQPRPGFITAAYVGGHIYVARSASPEDAVAYEYLHDVWAHLDPRQRARVTLLLDQFYAKHRAALQPRLNELIRADQSNGADPGAARLDELHSIACSRTRDEDLDPPLRAYCQVVLPGRQLTTKKY